MGRPFADCCVGKGLGTDLDVCLICDCRILAGETTYVPSFFFLVTQIIGCVAMF